MIRETAVQILGLGFVCDRCLGRQFAKLLRGCSNKERGETVRKFLAMENEAGEIRIDPLNFEGYKTKKAGKSGKCVVCEDKLKNLPEISGKILKKLKATDFESFLLGIKMSDSLVMNEEALWEKIGAKYAEPIKSEISRELGKMIAEGTGKKVDQVKPDILVIFDLQRMETEIFSNSLFIYGEYKKFVRGLPQTSSPRYRQTVQDFIARPFARATHASSHILHALGREDREARCLVWRPFVLELKQPIKRKVDMDRIKKEINRNTKIKVRNLRPSDRNEVSFLKSRRPHKIYRVVVEFEKKVENVEKVRKLVGVVKQRTPKRILGSKPDKIKHKKVKSIKWKRLNNKRYQFEITAESGLYLKELVSGDSGRTDPSISGMLGNRARAKEFDLIGLED